MASECVPPSLSIGELAEASGVSRRTVRYYVQRGLIDPPAGLGRGSVYSSKHLDQIARVTRLQREGVALENIQQSMASGVEPAGRDSRRANPNLVMRLEISEGIRLELDAGQLLPSPDVLDDLAAACRKILDRDSA